MEFEAYQASLPLEEVMKVGNKFYPIANGFGSYWGGNIHTLTELHINVNPYAIVERFNGKTYRGVLAFSDWYKNMYWIQRDRSDWKEFEYYLYSLYFYRLR